MVGGRNHDRIDIPVVDQRAVIGVLLWIGARLLRREVQVVLAEIADGDRFGIAEFEKGVVDLRAAVAESDVAMRTRSLRRGCVSG